ncbi:MAG: flagellar basal body-associated FliL family protein [Gallionella sp.]|nr:flagellar basal body-associated FliL family protein [Gallionella sp.]
MAKTTKPEKSDDQESAEGGGAAPAKKGKMKLFIVLALVMVLIAGGVLGFLLLSPKHEPQLDEDGAVIEVEEDAAIDQKTAGAPPKFVDLGTFTANLMREDYDRVLQIAISLKISNPELEQKIKDSAPEIQHRVNMVLQSKLPSDFSSGEGKSKLAQEIKGNVEHVLGLRKELPLPNEAEIPASAPVPTGNKQPKPFDTGIKEVLFTSLIIQ